jgi:hypothetical protein
MVAYYDEQGVYRDAQGNPSPDPRTGVINTGGIGESLANLFGAPYTPGGAWDPSMGGSDDYIGPTITHDPTALATGRSTGGTFMPVQIGTTGAATRAKGIQAGPDPTVFPDPAERANMAMNLTGEPTSVDAGNLPLPGTTVEGPGEFEPGAIGADVFEDPNALDPFGDRFDQPTANSPVKKVASGTTDTATTVKEPPAKATETVEAEPVADSSYFGGQGGLKEPTDAAGFERLLNIIGRIGDISTDVIGGAGRDLYAGGKKFFQRATPERAADQARLEAERIAARNASQGNIGTWLYNEDSPEAATERAARTNEAYSGADPDNSIYQRVLNQLLGESTEAPPASTVIPPKNINEALDVPLPAAANAPVDSSGTDRFAGQSKPNLATTGTDIEKGVTTLPLDSANTPLVDLVNQLAPLTTAQRAGLLSQLDPQDREIILEMLDDRDNIDNTGIVD